MDENIEILECSPFATYQGGSGTWDRLDWRARRPENMMLSQGRPDPGFLTLLGDHQATCVELSVFAGYIHLQQFMHKHVYLISLCALQMAPRGDAEQ